MKAITPFKVIQGYHARYRGINRKPVCNFLSVINTNWHPIADCCSNFGHFAFLSHPLGA